MPFTVIEGGDNKPRGKPKTRIVTETWNETVFLTSGDLLNCDFRIRQWCYQNECHISCLEQTSDIIAIPYFAAIFDADSLTNGVWSTLLDFDHNLFSEAQKLGINDLNFSNFSYDLYPTLIVLDKPENIKIPKGNHVTFINPEDPNIRNLIMGILDFAMNNSRNTISSF